MTDGTEQSSVRGLKLRIRHALQSDIGGSICNSSFTYGSQVKFEPSIPSPGRKESLNLLYPRVISGSFRSKINKKSPISSNIFNSSGPAVKESLFDSVKSQTVMHSLSNELRLSHVEYKKAQFRSVAIINSVSTYVNPDSGADKTDCDSVHKQESIFPSPAGPLRLKPILKRISSSQDQHILQAFYRFHLIVSNTHQSKVLNDVPSFIDLVLGKEDAAAYMRPSGKSASEVGFVPPSFNAIMYFCECVEDALVADPSSLLALRVPLDYGAAAAAAFLIGTYMLLRIGAAPCEVEARLVPFLATFQAAERSPGFSNDTSTAADCWRGLWKALQLGWLPIPARADQAAGPPDPFIADVQELVPGKLVVFRGPRALPGGAEWRDMVSGDGRPVGRDFSPAHMAGELRPLGVAAVVRLNAAEYPADAFPAEGLAFADLPVPEGGCPSPAVVAKFLRLLDAVPGAVAVHGGASLGRAGTLAALYAMRRHDFTACEAAGWLRIVRPGSISAPSQLEYLAGREAVLRRVAAAAVDDVGNASPLTQVALMLGRGGSLLPLRSGKAADPEIPAASEHEFLDGSGGCFARAAQVVAEVIAEVDARMLAIETSSSSPLPGWPARVLSETTRSGRAARLVRSGSFSASVSNNHSRTEKRRGSMWESCTAKFETEQLHSQV